MNVIGLTGGIGSGKTLCASLFSALGVPVYNADQRAKWLMNHDDRVKNHIIQLFGPEAYDLSGKLNRAYLSERVFNDRSLLSRLNAIVHPAVGTDTEHWVKEHMNEPYGIKEAAILFESGAYRTCREIICVYAPESLRIDRVMVRDKIEREAVLSRMKNQMDSDFILSLSNHIILNDGTHLLIPQIFKLHQRFLQLK